MTSRNFPISVIITAYNRENLISRCIDSVLEQTFKDIEIIIVDDFSTDKTRDIISEYSKKNHNIVCIYNNKNIGAGASKNCGLKVASGEYVGFVDSDDYVSRDYYENLYSLIKKTGCDIACGNLILEDSRKSTIVDPFSKNLWLIQNPNTLVDKENNIFKSEILVGHWSSASATTKLFKREKLLANPFGEMRTCDDLPAVFPLLAKENTIAFKNDIYYHYVMTSDSVERRFDLEKKLDGITAIAETIDRYNKLNIHEDYSKILIASSLLAILNTLFSNDIDKNYPLYNDIFTRLTSKICVQQLLTLVDCEYNTYLNHSLSFYNKTKKNQLYFILNVIKKACVISLKNTNFIKKSNPVVSIIIPVYNGSNYMIDAIDSALNQKYPNVEVVVVNDGSKDYGATDLIAKLYGNQIHYYYKANGGVATALNYGIEKMNGEYFSWLSHDDMYLPEKIKRQIDLLSTCDDKTTLVVDGYHVINEKAEFLYEVNLNNMYPHELLENSLFSVFRGGINGCSLLIHKSHFERVGLFRADLRTTQDYDMWFRMFRGQNLFYTNNSNVLSRVHQEQDSQRLSKSHLKECESLWINMMKCLTDEERIAIDGSVYNFYCNTYEFLKNNTPYNEASMYAQKMMYKKATVKKKSIIFFRYNMSKLVNAVKRIISMCHMENYLCDIKYRSNTLRCRVLHHIHPSKRKRRRYKEKYHYYRTKKQLK